MEDSDTYELGHPVENIIGKGIGKKLIDRCIGKARQLDARCLFLETNHKCAAAVHLYAKCGFYEIPIEHSEYARCGLVAA